METEISISCEPSNETEPDASPLIVIVLGVSSVDAVSAFPVKSPVTSAET